MEVGKIIFVTQYIKFLFGTGLGALVQKQSRLGEGHVCHTHNGSVLYIGIIYEYQEG